MYINGKKVPEEVIKLASLAKAADNVSKSVADEKAKMYWEGKRDAYEFVVKDSYTEFFPVVDAYVRANPNEYNQDETGVFTYFKYHYIGGTAKEHLAKMMASHASTIIHINSLNECGADSGYKIEAMIAIEHLVENIYGEPVVKSVRRWEDTLNLYEYIAPKRLEKQAYTWLEEMGING